MLKKLRKKLVLKKNSKKIEQLLLKLICVKQAQITAEEDFFRECSYDFLLESEMEWDIMMQTEERIECLRNYLVQKEEEYVVQLYKLAPFLEKQLERMLNIDMHTYHVVCHEEKGIEFPIPSALDDRKTRDKKVLGKFRNFEEASKAMYKKKEKDNVIYLKDNMWRILKNLYVLLLLVGCFYLQGLSANAQGPNRLIQTTTEEEMWNGYVNLGMTKIVVDDNESLEEVQEKVKESCVSISLYDSNGNTDKSFHASGFVIDITGEKIYIATNRHVCYMQWGPKYGYCISFANEEVNNILEKHQVKGTMLGYTGDNDYGDFAIIEMDISGLALEEKMMFKEVPIEKESMDTSVGKTIYFYHITPGREYQLKKAEIMETRQELTGAWALEKFHLQITPVSISGDSGSYFFDKKGNLMGMVVGATRRRTKDFDIKRTQILRPEAILDAYEAVVGMEWE